MNQRHHVLPSVSLSLQLAMNRSQKGVQLQQRSKSIPKLLIFFMKMIMPYLHCIQHFSFVKNWLINFKLMLDQPSNELFSQRVGTLTSFKSSFQLKVNIFWMLGHILIILGMALIISFSFSLYFLMDFSIFKNSISVRSFQTEQ